MRMRNDNLNYRKAIRNLFLLFLPVLMCCITQGVYAQNVPKKSASSRASRYSYLPSGYYKVGTTQLYYKLYSEAIDMIGYYKGYYYSSTYADYGYKLSVKVGNNSAMRVDCLNGTTTNGVTVKPSIVQQGELARICYTVTNNNGYDVVVSLGTHADVMIGNNDRAPISRRLDSFGQTYGLTMKDGNGAQLCVLFGSGLAGVSAASDFWFGQYSINYNPEQMVGNYSTGSYFMVENGSYDSGMGWCWKNRTIQAGATVVFSYLIGVGEVNLEPNSTFEVTPDDQEGWNDLSRPHRLTLTGVYESPAGLDGIVDYAVEDSEEWQALTETLASGEQFTGSLVATFDITKSIHQIRFRIRDVVGNTSLLHPIEYKDVSFHELSGIEDLTYTGETLLQTNVSCDLEEEVYALMAYTNNVNVGTASFNVEGVFPHTIGRKTYSFTINPQELSGEIIPDNTSVYNGKPITPNWVFSNEKYANLEVGNDYTISWSDNILPGKGQVTVEGMNNYCGSITAYFDIDKAQLTEDLFSLTLPVEDITYDGQCHGASITLEKGVGDATIYYQGKDEIDATTSQPCEAGEYTISLEFSEGTLYHGRTRYSVGTFTIYQLSQDEWATLQEGISLLSKMGWSQPWDISQGIASVASLHGLSIKKGHITSLDLSGQEIAGAFPFILLSFPKLQSVNLSKNNLSGDIGEGAYVFKQENPSLALGLENINISGNKLCGNIGLFANCFSNLRSLDASKNRLENVNPVIPSSIASLDISSQTISKVVPVHLSTLSIDDLTAKIPNILLYDHSSQTFTTDFNLTCNSNDNNWKIKMSSKNGQLDVRMVSNQNDYYGKSGDNFTAFVINDDGTREGSSFFISLEFDMGDCNFDGKVNLLDVQSTISKILNPSIIPLFNATAANTYSDELLNVQDVVSTVNIVLYNNKMSSASYSNGRMARANVATANKIYVEGEQLYLYNDSEVAAIEVTLSGVGVDEVSLALNRKDYQLTSRNTSNGSRHIIYSLSGKTIAAGTTALLRLSNSKAEPVDALLSSVDAKPLDVMVNPTPTAIKTAKTGKPTARFEDDHLILTLTEQIENAEVSVTSIAGVRLMNFTVGNLNAGETVLDANIPDGIYVVRIANNGKQIANIKIKK